MDGKIKAKRRADSKGISSKLPTPYMRAPELCQIEQSRTRTFILVRTRAAEVGARLRTELLARAGGGGVNGGDEGPTTIGVGDG